MHGDGGAAGAVAGVGAGAGASSVGAPVNETLLGGHPPDAPDDNDDADVSGNDDEAGGFFRSCTRPTMSRRALSARVYEGSP
jgi:hypothetical protein